MKNLGSIVDASKILDINKTGISIAVHQNGNKLHKGYYWKFKHPESYIEKLTDKQRVKLEQKQKETLDKLNCPITWDVCINNKPVGISYEYNGPIIKIIASAATAAKLLRGEKYTSFSGGVVGSHRRCYGFYWRYVSDETKETES